MNLFNDFLKFGYSEMYEWSGSDTSLTRLNRYGICVGFDPDYPDKIKLYTGKEKFLGITTINPEYVSDNSDIWPYKYLISEVGDLIHKESNIVTAEEKFDSIQELSYISTQNNKLFRPILNNKFKNDLKYVPRKERDEWTAVNLLGKCFVRDNGECKPGDFCSPYIGTDTNLIGRVVPTNDASKIKFYVLSRISDKSLLVLNKSF